jgi:hypothetical protein
MFEIATETVDGRWQTYYAGQDQNAALHEYTRQAERMTQAQIKRVQLRRDGQFMSEITM